MVAGYGFAQCRQKLEKEFRNVQWLAVEIDRAKVAIPYRPSEIMLREILLDKLIRTHSEMNAVRMRIALGVVDAALRGEKKFTLTQVVRHFDCSK